VNVQAAIDVIVGGNQPRAPRGASAPSRVRAAGRPMAIAPRAEGVMGDTIA